MRKHKRKALWLEEPEAKKVMQEAKEVSQKINADNPDSPIVLEHKKFLTALGITD